MEMDNLIKTIIMLFYNAMTGSNILLVSLAGIWEGLLFAKTWLDYPD